MRKLLFFFALALTLPMFADDVEAISVAEARARIDANNLGACYVRGKVKSINNFNPNYTNIIYWLTDTEDPTLEIQAYQFNAKDDQPYTSADQIEFKEGDEIIVYAKELRLYNNTSYEMKKGYYVSTVSSFQIEEISVSEALQRIQENKWDPCIVSGKVLSILTQDVDIVTYGNVSYWLADLDNPNDSIHAFRMQGKDNTKYSSAADIEFVVGDKIQVYAKGLTLYNNSIPELNTGYYLQTLSGKANDYVVIYRDKNNGVLDSEAVTLTLPEVPEVAGFTFLKWIVTASDLSDGINIQAVYQYNGDAASAPEVVNVPGNKAKKLVRNGNVYILSDGKTYTTTGIRVK